MTGKQRFKAGVCVNLLPDAVPGPFASGRGRGGSDEAATQGSGIFTLVFLFPMCKQMQCALNW